MSFSRSKFPGRLAKRSHHHNRERFSFRDGRILSEIEIQLKRNKEDPHSPIKELQLLEQGKQEAELKKRNDESALVASQTATNLKAFRSLFGSSDESEEEFPGFEELGSYTEKIKSKLREKLGKIQRDIFSLQTEILTNGNHLLNEFNEIEQKLPNFTSALPIPVSKTRTKELNEAFAKRRMPPPIATKVRRSGRLSSLLPLDLEKPNTSVLCINSIPMVKHVSEIPQPLDGTSSSGKFLVETDGSSCSEEDEEIESISGIVSPIPDVLQTSARELIQLNRCPVQMDDEQGFPIIIDTARGSIPPKPLCFSCGSAGIEQV